MRISIKSDGREIKIPFPTGILFSGVGRRFLKKHLPDNEIGTLSSSSLRKLYRVVKTVKRQRKDWYIAEIQTSDGEYIRIKL